jgi:hypothetical protein
MVKCDICNKIIESTDYTLTPQNTQIKLHLECAKQYQKMSLEEQKLIQIIAKCNKEYEQTYTSIVVDSIGDN